MTAVARKASKPAEDSDWTRSLPIEPRRRALTPREGTPRYTAPPDRNHPVLTVLAGDQVGLMVPLNGRELVIGRSGEADLGFSEATVSRSHARIVPMANQFFVEDLESTNGTFVNGQRIRARSALREGDRIGVGSHIVLKFSIIDALEEQAAIGLYESSVRDPLSGLYNRRYLEHRLKGELAYSQRHDVPVSALLIDIDHFKRVNDVYGHRTGDRVLKVVAKSLQRLVRPEDVVARYGGEEFVILARRTNARNAMIFAERVRRTIAQARFSDLRPELRLSVSIGVASAERDAEADGPRLLADADRAMYEAKMNGRNCVALALSSPGRSMESRSPCRPP